MSDTIRSTEVLRSLSDVEVIESGMDEQERSDGLYESYWWVIPAEDFEKLDESIFQYSNVHSSTPGPANSPASGTARIVVSECIRPVPPEDDYPPEDVLEEQRKEEAEWYKGQYEDAQE